MERNKVLDEVLNKISLAFGAESVDLIFPESMLVDLSLYQIANIDKANLEDELVYQSKIYMLFVTILAHVTEKSARADAELKRLDSRLSFQYEKQLKESGDRVSDKKIEKLVEGDPEYIEKGDEQMSCKNLVKTFTNIVTGLDNKRDMLLQLSAKRRAEMKGDMNG